MSILMIVLIQFQTVDTPTLRGTLEFSAVEGGAWTLRVGKLTYDLHGDIQGFKTGDRVVVRGRVRKDKACIHQVGIVFEVTSIRK